MLTLGDKIRYFRKRSGLSQMELEIEIGSASGSVSRIENGETDPTKQTLVKVADALSLSTHERFYLLDIGYENPSEREVQNAVVHFKSLLESEEVLGYLLDNKSQILAISAGFRNLAKLQGINSEKILNHHVSEVLFNPDLGLRSLIPPDKFAEVALPVLAVLNQERKFLLSDPWWKDLIGKLKTFADFERLWSQVQELQLDLYSPSARTLYLTVVSNSLSLTYHITTLQIDPRFSFLEYR